MLRSGLRQAAVFGALATAFAGGLWSVSALRRHFGETQPRNYRSDTLLTPRTELLAVFVGSSTCVAAHERVLPLAVRAAVASLRATATDSSWTFATLGLAVDWNVSDGMQFLNSIYPFDEVSSGHNWFNVTALSYAFPNDSQPAALPELIVVRRVFSVGSEGPRIVSQTEVSRHVGLSAISDISVSRTASVSASGRL
jgi:hypothetical protein